MINLTILLPNLFIWYPIPSATSCSLPAEIYKFNGKFLIINNFCLYYLSKFKENISLINLR